MLAQAVDPSNAEIVELLKETLSGTPDAAKAEPFTWIMLLSVVALVLIGCMFGRKAINDFMEFIDKQNVAQKQMQQECHKQSREALQTVAESAQKCEVALATHATVMREHTDVMERVILKLGSP